MTDKTPPVERFDPNWFDRSMDYSASGGYVRYSDYTTLSARLALSEGALDICSKSWGECNTQLDAANQRIAELETTIKSCRAVLKAEKLCDYCDEADPMRQAMCLAKECGVKDV